MCTRGEWAGMDMDLFRSKSRLYAVKLYKTPLYVEVDLKIIYNECS